MSIREVEVFDARLEEVTTGTRDVKCNSVNSIPSAFGGGGVVVSCNVPGKRGYVRISTGL